MDEMIDAALIGHLACLLRQVGVQPTALAASGVADQKLRRRVDIVRDALLVDLPPGYVETAAVVRAAFEDETFTGWMLWPVSEAVVDRALGSGSAKDFDDALDVLALLTTRLSGEFAIRTMLGAGLDRTLEVVEGWTSSADPHVRRLASEGTRSHLPWARGVPELVRDSTWSVKTPRGVKDRFVAVNAATADMAQDLDRAPTASELAAHLGLSREEVLEAIAARNSYQSGSLDEALDDDDGAGLAGVLGVVDGDLVQVEVRAQVCELVARLPQRERMIIVLRFLHEKTQAEIGDEIGISQMHVSRLLARTLAQLRSEIDRQIAATAHADGPRELIPGA